MTSKSYELEDNDKLRFCFHRFKIYAEYGLGNGKHHLAKIKFKNSILGLYSLKRANKLGITPLGFDITKIEKSGIPYEKNSVTGSVTVDVSELSRNEQINHMIPFRKQVRVRKQK